MAHSQLIWNNDPRPIGLCRVAHGFHVWLRLRTGITLEHTYSLLKGITENLGALASYLTPRLADSVAEFSNDPWNPETPEGPISVHGM
ncbi:predicted protein [Chaetomium globosum CBS 148.51]|uniref:Uncharacterized protein n=1 Tax=Chaetomium globosum (strain ATCC 6205 / CBS 148.51 / DSM 1962 / NBRC 6347 / NRRL 1970) TaxID=306901 RepID=Q2GZW3_CHAGB|nr:uncharacterized protein CHGG_04933 [Chaetomium globosum CBS 148.51]EAQ88314.1 predicted protein [Chaetomium globosum CBS 148.51]